MDVAIRFFQQTMKLLVSVAFLGSVLAHFDLVEPKGRVINEATAKEAPCGGASMSTIRTKVFLEESIIATTIYHKNTTITYKISLKDNPNQNDFIQLLPNATVDKASTVRTSSIDFTKISGVKENINATLQVYSEDEEESMYQCIDVTFIKKSSNSATSLSSNILIVLAAFFLL
jgi:hypothetical protein